MAAKILLLDDDPDLVDAFRDLLAEAGYVVETKLERVFADVLSAGPDLLMIDAPPGDEGKTLNFVQRLRLRPETTKLPIILVTTNLRYVEPAILRSQRIHVMVKPFELDDLLSSVAKMLPDVAVGGVSSA